MNITPSPSVKPTFQGALPSQRVSTPPVTFGANEPDNYSWANLGKQLLSALYATIFNPATLFGSKYVKPEPTEPLPISEDVRSFVERTMIPPNPSVRLLFSDNQEGGKVERLASFIEERKNTEAPSGIVLNGNNLAIKNIEIISAICHDKEMPLLVIESQDIESRVTPLFSKVLEAAKYVAKKGGACTVYFKDIPDFLTHSHPDSSAFLAQLKGELESESTNVTFLFDKPYSPGESEIEPALLRLEKGSGELKVLDFSNLQEASRLN